MTDEKDAELETLRELLIDCETERDMYRADDDEIGRLQAKCRLLEADLAFHYAYRQEIERGKLEDTNG